MTDTVCCPVRADAAGTGESGLRQQIVERGLALIAVLVAMSMLLAIAVAITASMSTERDRVNHYVHRAQTRIDVEGVRGLVLHQSTGSDHATDPTPNFDRKTEFPQSLTLPAAFHSGDEDSSYSHPLIVSGEVSDLSAKIQLNTCSPLTLANLLSLHATVAEDVAPDGTSLRINEAGRFQPQGGAIVVDGEVMQYERFDGSTFEGLKRTQVDHPLPVEAMVLDYRCVLVATYQFQRTGPGCKTRQPFGSVAEVQRIAEAGAGSFSASELQLLRRHCTTDGGLEWSAEFGRAERVFDGLTAGVSRTIRVASGLGFGAGTVVRIRSRDGGAAEYGLVCQTSRPTGATGTVNLQSRWQLVLLEPVRNNYDSLETVVEPLVRHPVNINTAAEPVLLACLLNLRSTPSQHADRKPGGGSRYGKKVDAQLAGQMVRDILALRGDAELGSEHADVQKIGPFESVGDLFGRLFRLWTGRTEDKAARWLLAQVARNMLTGRDPAIDMNTQPMSLTSASRVEYRVATMRNRDSGGEAAREERRGVASVMRNETLVMEMRSQHDWEEAWRLSRQAPGYISYPILVGPQNPFELGVDPADRVPAYLYGMLFPDSGLGESRYPSTDMADTSTRAQAAIAPWGRRPQVKLQLAHESFFGSAHPDGHDTRRQGKHDLFNARGLGKAGKPAGGGRHDARFPFTTQRDGLPIPFGSQWWFKLENLNEQTLYDFAADSPDRNRISLRIEAKDLVFEVLDEAGIDPQPSIVQTTPERNAAQWRIPVQDIRLQRDVFNHVNIGAIGNQPWQLTFTFDGVPRGDPKFRTYLSADLASYKRPLEDRPDAGTNPDRFVKIAVESTEHFPPQGVIRIGRELFEYTSKDNGTFHCKFEDSFGGRKARMSWYEFRDDLETDNAGRPTRSREEITDEEPEQTPAHKRGAAVELYGYAAPIYRNLPITTGQAKLADTVGTFAVARAFLKSPEPIIIPTPSGAPLRLGAGLNEDSVADLELADPLPDQSGKGYPPNPADARIADAFPASGGYALLLQREVTGVSTDPRVSGTVDVGGAELIRYGSRKGNVLSKIERAVTITGLQAPSNGVFDGKARKFVTDWQDVVLIGSGGSGGKPLRIAELPGFILFVLPLSLPVQGNVTNPQTLGLTEWLQIYPGKGKENETEWVRYNYLLDGRHILRASPNIFRRMHNTITGQVGRTQIDLGRLGGSGRGSVNAPTYPSPDPRDVGANRIGFVEKLEQDFPVIYAARIALAFRGDPFTGTTPHPHDGSAVLLPTHRLELDRGRLGALGARTGRNDRVALVGGNNANGQSRPTVEWHVVNWVCQRHGFDNTNNNANSPTQGTVERLGQYPFQLVGFKGPVLDTFVGPAQRDDFLDTRRVDRVVKFPAGELPAAYVEAARYGGASPAGGLPDMVGHIDEIGIVERGDLPMVLEADLTEDAREFKVMPNVRLYPYGPVTVTQDVTQSTPDTGGLVSIDGEILAYARRADGRFEIATEGRGLLNTQPRAHAQGAKVTFLEQIPAAILSGGVSESSEQLVTQGLNALPRHGGTLLLGRELLHYTWTVGNQMLEMPTWVDPQRQETKGRGLFRGRYGTAANPAGAGQPVIWFPIRYWDRFHERAEDPEMHHAQVTLNQTPVFLRGIAYEVENPDEAQLEMHCYVRLDGQSSFSADPVGNGHLFRFTTPQRQGAELTLLPIMAQAGTAEVRFVTIYKPGSFDPVTFVASAWKRRPALRRVVLGYEGETRILKETVVCR